MVRSKLTRGSPSGERVGSLGVPHRGRHPIAARAVNAIAAMAAARLPVAHQTLAIPVDRAFRGSEGHRAALFVFLAFDVGKSISGKSSVRITMPTMAGVWDSGDYRLPERQPFDSSSRATKMGIGGESVRPHVVQCRLKASTTSKYQYHLHVRIVRGRPLPSMTIPHIMWEDMREKTDALRRHPHHALSARTVQTLKANGRVQRIADGGGLYVVVAPNGSKSWVLRVVVKQKRSDLGLGSTKLVTLAEAREEAHRLRKIARAGGDPIADRRHERRPVPSFRTAAEEVHKALSQTFRSPKHSLQWLASLDPVFIAFGAKRVDAVTTADIMAALEPHWLVTPETSRRVLQRVRRIFDWSSGKGFRVGNNPTQGVAQVLPKQPRITRHHAALPYAEAPAFIQALRAVDAAEGVKLALELTVLCGMRTIETIRATWNEFDMQAKTWTIPGARMKAGEEHRVPLASRALEIVGRAKVLANGSPYVFPGRSAKKPLSNMALLMLLRRMKRSDITVHGFRSTLRDWSEDCTNYPRAVSEAVLAHKLKDKTERAYRRSDLFNRRRALMDDWDRFVTSSPAPRAES
jgi:integrase